MKFFFPAEALAVLLYVTGWFLLSTRAGRNDLADAAWGPGFIIVALTATASTGRPTARALLVLLLVSIWGIRLAFHIGSRLRGKEEDPRYRRWRENWGSHQLLGAYLQVFLLQGLLMLVISLPVILAIRAKGPPLGALDLFGAAVWLGGFAFEAVGDRQFARFRRNPANRGRVMEEGLWRYTRHPNYFGEVVLWWGIYLIALSAPWGWVTIAGPLTITVLILAVSGVPLAEAQMEGNSDYRDYRRRTSAFFPFPPKK